MTTERKAKPNGKGTSRAQRTLVGHKVQVPAEGRREGHARCATEARDRSGFSSPTSRSGLWMVGAPRTWRVPPGASKDTRYIDIHERHELDEAQMVTWVKQAAALPGFLGPRP